MSRLILIKNISEEFSISESAASDYIKSIFDSILETLSSGKNVNIAGFGKFIFKHNKISFSPSRRFSEAVNYNFAGLETIKIRSYGEKEFQEKINFLKRRVESFEVELVGEEKEDITGYMPEAASPKIPESFLAVERKEFEDYIRKENLSIPPGQITHGTDDIKINAEDVENDDDSDVDIEDFASVAIDKFLRDNFGEQIKEEQVFITREPGKPELIPGADTEEIPSAELPALEPVIEEKYPEEILPDKQKEKDASDGAEIIEPVKESLAPDLKVFLRKTAPPEIPELKEIIHEDKTGIIPGSLKETTKGTEEKIEDKLIPGDAGAIKDDLAKMIAEREKSIEEIEKTFNFTAETFKKKDADVIFKPPEPEDKIKDETEEKAQDTIIDVPGEIIPEPPAKEITIEGYDDILKEREKTLKELEKSSSFTTESFKRKDEDKTTEFHEPEEKSEEIKEPPQDIASGTNQQETETPEKSYKDILEDRRKEIERKLDNPQFIVFDSLTDEANKQADIDDFISGLDKIRENLKSREVSAIEETMPETENLTEEIQATPKESLIPGEVKDLHFEIEKPVESQGIISNFNDVFIEDNEMILYNTKGNDKASEELFKSGNLKNYDDIFSRFDADKKSGNAAKTKETDKKIIGLIWFVIIAAIVTILVLIFS